MSEPKASAGALPALPANEASTPARARSAPEHSGGKPRGVDTPRPAPEGQTNHPHVLTFGCRLNAYESEVMREHAAAAESGVETVIVNTCAVTAEAERQARQAIRKLRRERPGARIVVTGCAAQVHPEKFAGMPEVDQVLGNADKMKPESFRAPSPERIVVTDIMQVREVASHLVSGFEGRARAFVEVQQGCDHRCTFCIIPFGRGPNRSVPLQRVVAQVRELAAQGFNEVVLTGVDVTSYGGDLPERPSFGELVRRLLAEVPELPRLRLSSLDPVGVDEALLAAVAEEPRLMPHFHLSVQAGDDMVLKRMKRRHTRDDVLRLAERLRSLRGDVALGADLIAGFPTEDDEMFGRSLALVDEAGFSHLHVFPFSPRPGTPAARMPQVGRAVAKARAALLRSKGEAAMAAFLAARVGRQASVLVEGEGEGFCEHYLPVKVASGRPGELVTVRVGSVVGDRLEGRPI
jgi:threonylcarbamoyladenosine tRNA methylthiotransferase MtaB